MGVETNNSPFYADTSNYCYTTMAHLHIETQLFEARPLTLRTGKEIWLKFESMQPTGSFKVRGIG